MNIVINGEPKLVSHTMLGAVIGELGYENAVIATAVNGDFVAAESRDDLVLKEGDKIEILAPMQGG